MAKQPPKTDNTVKKQPVQKRAQQLAPYQFKAGAPSANPAGRPKGSRNKFAEAFVQAFQADFEKHGAEAIAQCRKKDVSAYIAAATRIMPKDFNLNVSQELSLDRLLDKFSTEQLKDLAAGLAALGASHRSKTIEGTARSEPDSIH